MFESLKKKLSSWISGTTEKKPKKEKKGKKAKVPKTTKTKASKKTGKQTIETKLKKEADKIKEEVPLKFEPAASTISPSVNLYCIW
jgi:hypothetical protein